MSCFLFNDSILRVHGERDFSMEMEPGFLALFKNYKKFNNKKEIFFQMKVMNIKI